MIVESRAGSLQHYPTCFCIPLVTKEKKVVDWLFAGMWLICD
ncbi:hypothetical protein LSH36_729g02050 [Paralvinella palmiformis]|uniref:Uncharacterized protein n=1 Tax=Paralvinella palmiformis TaxID=53620 RepID=A0AAD9J381_9ANNE|nr:hypothetical protein LSH36_729g02050 [Paralvinella palmiformis]